MYPEDVAVETWDYNSIGCSIVSQDTGHYCGYARFKTRPLIEPGYNGIATYVPVHGGITYAVQQDEGFVYGFDCAHFDSPSNPTMDWLRQQTELMAQAICLAAESYEHQYLACNDNECKSAVLEAFHQRMIADGLIGTDEVLNFGTMLNILSGRL